MVALIESYAPKAEDPHRLKRVGRFFVERGSFAGQSRLQVLDASGEKMALATNERQAPPLAQKEDREFIGTSRSGDESTAVDAFQAMALDDEIAKYPEVQKALRSVYNRTYWTDNADIVDEQGLFIVRNPQTGGLEVITGPFSSSNRRIYLDPRFIPEGMQLVASVHSHPHNGRPSYSADYPSFKPDGSPKKDAWAIVITKETSYFISPNQKNAGHSNFDTNKLIGK